MYRSPASGTVTRRTFGDVDDRGAVQRVAVHPDDGLLVDRVGHAVLHTVDAARVDCREANIRSVSARTKFSMVTRTATRSPGAQHSQVSRRRPSGLDE